MGAVDPFSEQISRGQSGRVLRHESEGLAVVQEDHTGFA